MLYFAYGSNMYTPRLRYRVKSAKPIGVGTLHGRDLAWHKRSKNDGSGKCNLRGCEGSRIFGVVFEIDAQEKSALDRAEGLGYGYNEHQLEVDLADKSLMAFTYLAAPTYIDDSLCPYTWYKDFVLAGAEEHGLPAGYIQRITDQPAIADPDSERETLERNKIVS